METSAQGKKFLNCHYSQNCIKQGLLQSFLWYKTIIYKHTHTRTSVTCFSISTVIVHYQKTSLHFKLRSIHKILYLIRLFTSWELTINKKTYALQKQIPLKECTLRKLTETQRVSSCFSKMAQCHSIHIFLLLQSICSCSDMVTGHN